MEESIDLIREGLLASKKYQLEPEFVWCLIKLLRNNPNLTDEEVVIYALREWDIE